MVRQQDAVGLALFGAKPGLFVPPRCRRSHLRQLMAAMVRQIPAGAASLPSAIEKMTNKLKRRGLVVLISDLIDDPEQTLRAIMTHVSTPARRPVSMSTSMSPT